MRRLPSLAHELAYEVEAAALTAVCRTLRDAEELKFEMLMDLAGVDYLHFGLDDWQTQSATRTGFRIGRVGPKTAILARRTTWLSAPAMTIGFGVSEKPE